MLRSLVWCGVVFGLVGSAHASVPNALAGTDLTLLPEIYHNCSLFLRRRYLTSDIAL